jgi:BirA family biotin operon repressor/biotin-[acetyl-CoA-carboxylase] ligase
MTVDARILIALRAAGTGSVSGAEMALSLGISRAAVWARIQDLRKLGFDVSASPHLGYRLLSSPDCLLADDLLSRLGLTRVVGRQIQVFRETTSTNDIVERLAQDGLKEGVVVFAEGQTKGRGRLGRKWHSPAGKGLWFSVLLRPSIRPQEATRIMVGAATALARAIRKSTGVTVEIKWPNDILVRGRKVAGMLMEISAELDTIRHVVLGTGIDVNLGPEHFSGDLRSTATSLQMEAGRPIDRAELAAAILRELDADYTRIVSGRFEAVVAEWQSLCSTLGHFVSIRMGDRVIRGHADSLDSDGSLLVRTQDSRLEKITGGDVTLVKK